MAKEDTPPIVEFKSVTKTFNANTSKAFTAIRDVTFSVEDVEGHGEFVAILGPSGCGKSTVLRLIAGLAPQHPATRGEVLLSGKPIVCPGPDRGMVFQDYTSFDNRTVLDNVAFPLREHTNLNFTVAQDALLCVVLGCGRILDRFEQYDKVLMKPFRD